MNRIASSEVEHHHKDQTYQIYQRFKDNSDFQSLLKMESVTMDKVLQTNNNCDVVSLNLKYDVVSG